MPTFTTNYNLAKPLVNSAVDQDLWGTELNSDLDIIDTTMKTIADAVAAVAALVYPIGSLLTPVLLALAVHLALYQPTKLHIVGKEQHKGLK